MIILKNLPSMADQQLKKITRAVYVVKSTNHEFPNLYSCGAAGTRPGKNGNLLNRFKSHAKDSRLCFQKNGNQLYRHKTSPFQKRVWALHLVGWTELGTQLAEHALYFRLSLSFKFVGESCFLARSDADVLDTVKGAISDLCGIAAAGNSTAAENSTLPEIKVVPPSASP